MINDDERDYAEEAFNRADLRREAEAEAAFEALAGRVTSALRDLSTEANVDALVAVERLADEVGLRLAPNVHRYDLLARQQHVAFLAVTAAAAVEEFVGYDLDAVVQGAVTAYRSQHTDPDGGRRARTALALACEQVLGAVRSVLDAEKQEQLDTREQADLDETHRSLR